MIYYSLYDAYTHNRDKIVKCVGIEYFNLNIKNLRILLIHKLRQFKLLDIDSINITENTKFYPLISKSSEELSKFSKYNSELYELDLILLELNTESSINLIVKYGSNKARDILRDNVLNMLDINSLKIYYKHSEYKKFINSNIRSIYNNLISNSIPLPIPIRDILIDFVIPSNFKSTITFELLIEFYNDDYSRLFYNKYLQEHMKECAAAYYSVALSNDNEDDCKKYLKIIRENEEERNLYLYAAIPLDHILVLIKEVPELYDIEEKRLLLIKAILIERGRKNNVTNEELSILKILLDNITKGEHNIHNIHGPTYLLIECILCPKIYKLVFDIFNDNNSSNINTLINSYVLSISDSITEYIKEEYRPWSPTFFDILYEDLLVTAGKAYADRWIVDNLPWMLIVAFSDYNSGDDDSYVPSNFNEVLYLKGYLNVASKHKFSKKLIGIILRELYRSSFVNDETKEWIVYYVNSEIV